MVWRRWLVISMMMACTGSRTGTEAPAPPSELPPAPAVEAPEPPAPPAPAAEEPADPTGQMCGGFAGLKCPDGYRCVDDPNDACDPAQNHADCAGICEPG